jgi:siroheme synthase (precorrin-2 oxidase/ferrochelatase)
VRLLPLFHDVAGRPVVVAGEGEAADAKRRLVREAGGEPVDDHADARLAFVAGDAPEAAARRALKARGLLVNVADGRTCATSWCPQSWTARGDDRGVQRRRLGGSGEGG